MKKRLLFIVPLFGLLALTGCSGSDESSQPVASSTPSSVSSPVSSSVQGSVRNANTVKEKFEQNGYTVSSESMGGISALVAVKNADTLTVLFFSSTSLATSSMPIYEMTADTLGYTCKQDGANIYYGTANAIAIYDSMI